MRKLFTLLILSLFFAVTATAQYNLIFNQPYFDGGSASTSAIDDAFPIDYESADNFSALTDNVEEVIFYGLAMKYVDGVGWVEQTPAATEPFFIRFYTYETGVTPGLVAPTTGTYEIVLEDDYGDGWNDGLVSVFVDGVAVLTDLTLLTGYGPETHTFSANAGQYISTVYTPGDYAYENYYTIFDPDGNIIATDGDPGVTAPTGIPMGGLPMVLEPDWANPVSTQAITATVENIGTVWTGTRQLYKFTATLNTAVEMTEGWVSAQIDANTGSGTWFLWLNSQTGDALSWQRTEALLLRSPMPRVNLAKISMDGSSRAQAAYDFGLELWGGVLTEPPPCATNPVPADGSANVSNLTSLSWTGNPLAEGYKIYFGTDNPPTNIEDGTDLGLVTTYVPANPLEYSTEYFWKIVPYNTAGGDATECDRLSFNTLSDPTITTFPYTQSFDGETFAPLGWTNIKTSGTGVPGTWDRQTAGTSPTCTPHTGAAMARYNAYNLATGTKGELSTPPINFPADNYRVSFWMYRDPGYATTTDLVNVYYNTTNSSAGGTLLGTVNRSMTLAPAVAVEGWYQYVFNMPTGATGNGRYLVFEGVSAFGNNMFVDDITIEMIQAAVPNPATLVFPYDAMTTFSNPTLQWTPAATGEPAAGYKVYLDGNSNPTTEVYNGTNTVFPVTGLVAGNTYYWKVVPYNATGDATGVSTWSFTVVADGYLAESFELTTFPPAGWANPGSWSRSTTYAFNGVASAYKFTSTTQNLLRTPLLTINASSNIKFFARTPTANTGQRIQVQYSADGTTWTNVGAEISLPQAGPWAQYSVDLSSLTPGNYYLAFATYYVVSSGSVYMDHVIGPLVTPLLPNAVTLVAPADLATNVVSTPSLSWTPAATGGIPTGYKIYLDQNTDPTTLFATVAASPYTVTPPLSYSTTYYWKVVAYNGVGDGPASTIRSFTVQADPTLTPPFTEPFVTYPPLNWTEATGLLADPSVLTGTSSAWYGDGFANIGTTGAAAINIYGTSRKEWMITPPINLGDGSTDFELRFDLALTDYLNAAPITSDPNGTTGIDDKFAVVISLDNGVTWSSANTLRLWDNAGSSYVYNSISYTGETVIIDLSTYSGIVRIGFYGESTVSNADNDLFVDNVTVQQPPLCEMPTGIQIPDFTQTTATISWTAASPAPANGYQWEVRNTSDEVISSGSTAAGITTASATNLVASTPYNAYVRSVCSEGIYSAWAGPVPFTTACGVASVPFSESFDGTLFAPVCWTNLKTAGTGTPGIWDRQTSGTFPTCAPHSGAAMARYNAFGLSSGTTGILVTPQMVIPSDQYVVNFWMYRDDGYPTTADRVNVYYNTSPNTTSATLLGTINRSYTLSPVEATANQWYNYEFLMPAGTSGDAYIVFEAVSVYGNNIFMDDVSVVAYVPSTKTLNLKAYIQGFWNGAGMNQTQDSDGENTWNKFSGTTVDTLSVYLADNADPFGFVFSAHEVGINTDGTMTVTVPAAFSGSYYIALDHHSSVETWSMNPVDFSGTIINYDFTVSADQAYGSNQYDLGAGTAWGLFSGDVNDDEYIESALDMYPIYNLSLIGTYGYMKEDLNGDGFVDFFDYIFICYNNAIISVGINTPANPAKRPGFMNIKLTD
ncbi:MAG: choice-of-anchor J domain-containing protein [Lentimicrobium sp.]